MDQKPCGLICGIVSAQAKTWALRLNEFILGFKPAALVLSPPFEEVAKVIVRDGNALDLAVLLSGDIEAAAKLEAAGVFLPGSCPFTQVSKARERLGSGAIIGAGTGLTRHEAMEKAEAGADFIAFEVGVEQDLGKALELTNWWDQMTIVPCALALGTIVPPLGSLRQGRPDFLFWQETAAGEALALAKKFGLQSEDAVGAD